MCVRASVWVWVCLSLYMCLVRICIYIYMYMYININIYIYIYISSRRRFGCRRGIVAAAFIRPGLGTMGCVLFTFTE